jgi:hypothetical protein
MFRSIIWALISRCTALRTPAEWRVGGGGQYEWGDDVGQGAHAFAYGPAVDPGAGAFAVDQAGFAQDFQAVADGGAGQAARVRPHTQASPPSAVAIRESS